MKEKGLNGTFTSKYMTTQPAKVMQRNVGLASLKTFTTQ